MFGGRLAASGTCVERFGAFLESQGDDEGGEWEVCRDEFEEKVLEMMSEGRGFLRQPRA